MKSTEVVPLGKDAWHVHSGVGLHMASLTSAEAPKSSTAASTLMGLSESTGIAGGASKQASPFGEVELCDAGAPWYAAAYASVAKA